MFEAVPESPTFTVHRATSTKSHADTNATIHGAHRNDCSQVTFADIILTEAAVH